MATQRIKHYTHHTAFISGSQFIFLIILLCWNGRHSVNMMESPITYDFASIDKYSTLGVLVITTYSCWLLLRYAPWNDCCIKRDKQFFLRRLFVLGMMEYYVRVWFWKNTLCVYLSVFILVFELILLILEQLFLYQTSCKTLICGCPLLCSFGDIKYEPIVLNDGDDEFRIIIV